MHAPSQRLDQAALGLIALASFFGCSESDALSQSKPEPPTTPPSAKETVVVQRPRLVLLEAREPRRKDKDSWYYLQTHLDAYEALGFPTPEGQKWREFRPNGFIANEEETRHYRLPDGRHAVALYHSGHYYSLVLIYKYPAQKPGDKALTRATTEDGSLEAWLLRHEGHEYGEHYLPLDPWKRFLSASAEDRAKQPKAFRLEGSLRVKEDQFGLLESMTGVNLRSAKPLPVFVEYLDFEEKQAKEIYDIDRRAADAHTRMAEIKKRYQEETQYLALQRQGGATEPLTIRGWIHGRWGPPPPNIKPSP
jgi:hypothetical protein